MKTVDAAAASVAEALLSKQQTTIRGWGRRSGTLSPAQAQERVRMRVGLGVGREDRVATAVHAQRRD